MRACSSCGEENSDRARFCSACGAALADAPVAPAEERKVVSILFADLVGFTARSDRADPEDVRATLRPYHARLKREIERFGGTVEKFIGDAVMAVFGAPAAHEDDAERAVRAALRIVDAIPELNEGRPGLDLAVRVAVNTGEGLVNLAAHPGEGEGIVTGDVVNTASRLQSEAPVGGVVVGEASYRSTKELFDYEQLDPVAVRGKADPIPIWRVVAPRAGYRLETGGAIRSPFIGREVERTLLEQTFRRAVREEGVQLVTVTGEPGVGKSRLIHEFSMFIDDLPDLVWWRQGRCLPYGEGITFWALGEVVKSQAGILESDTPDDAMRKLTDAVAVVEDRPDRDWVLSRLAPLVGAGGSDDPAERGESFAAWRAFLEALAAIRPLVLIFEDLHWADEAMLEFVEHLVDWSTGVPILVVCAARPELYERTPGWSGGKRNAVAISLSPLSSQESDELISALLGDVALPTATKDVLLERSGGNPLYTEEFARMVTERAIAEAGDDGRDIRSVQDISVPETVHALIAARLDTLPVERKAVLHDAAVIGRVFWSGAVASMSGIAENEARGRLHELSRKELVRPMRTTSVKDQAEYSFWHALVRDVAYGQIPRAARARKHVAAAGWIEQLAGERVADQAELLAYHYREAIRLARAAGIESEFAGLTGRFRTFLLIAADRNRELDTRRAIAYYEEALELFGSDESGRRDVLVQAADIARISGDYAKAEAFADEALRGARESGDIKGEANALLILASIEWIRGNNERQRELNLKARILLEKLEPSSQLVRAYTRRAFGYWLRGDLAEALAANEKALDIARRVEEKTGMLDALQQRGTLRVDAGEVAAGLGDLRDALRLSLESGLSRMAALTYNNLANALWVAEGVPAALETYRAGIEFDRRRGLGSQEEWSSAEMLWALFDAGGWDELLSTAEDVIDRERVHGSGQIGVFARTYSARVLVARGELEAARRLMEEALPRARQVADLQIVVPAFAVAAFVRAAAGLKDEAVALVVELRDATRNLPSWRAIELPLMIRVATRCRALELAETLPVSEFVRLRDQNALLTALAVLSEARGELAEAAEGYRRAADAWDGFGHVIERALAQLAEGRCLAGLGRAADATQPVTAARETFAALGALPLIEEADAILHAGT